MAETFDAGDVVHLKSGGPAMTVKELKADGSHVVCDWFGTTEELKTAVFRLDALTVTNGVGVPKD